LKPTSIFIVTRADAGPANTFDVHELTGDAQPGSACAPGVFRGLLAKVFEIDPFNCPPV
jgi:hypothetical protein